MHVKVLTLSMVLVVAILLSLVVGAQLANNYGYVRSATTTSVTTASTTVTKDVAEFTTETVIAASPQNVTVSGSIISNYYEPLNITFYSETANTTGKYGQPTFVSNITIISKDALYEAKGYYSYMANYTITVPNNNAYQVTLEINPENDTYYPCIFPPCGVVTIPLGLLFLGINSLIFQPFLQSYDIMCNPATYYNSSQILCYTWYNLGE